MLVYWWLMSQRALVVWGIADNPCKKILYLIQHMGPLSNYLPTTIITYPYSQENQRNVKQITGFTHAHPKDVPSLKNLGHPNVDLSQHFFGNMATTEVRSLVLLPLTKVRMKQPGSAGHPIVCNSLVGFHVDRSIKMTVAVREWHRLLIPSLPLTIHDASVAQGVQRMLSVLWWDFW